MKIPPSRMPTVIAEGYDGTEYPFEDLSAYESTLVFKTPRRLHPNVWNVVLADHGPHIPLHYIEIGCQEGSGTLWFLEHKLGHPESTITSIDVFSHTEHQTIQHNIDVCGLSSSVRIIKGRSGEVLRQLPCYEYDMIYVDGQHACSGVIEDAVLSWRLLKTGGILIFDDYGWAGRPHPLDQPKHAIDFFLTVYEGQYEVMVHDFQVVIRKTVDVNAFEGYRSGPMIGRSG